MLQRILSFQPIRNYINPTSPLIVMMCAVIALSSCSSEPVHRKTSIFEANDAPTQNKTNATQGLEAEIRAAKQAQAWGNYLELSQLLWSKATPDNQLAIEYQIWQTLKALPEAEKTKLTDSQESPVELKDWLAFCRTTELSPIWQKSALADLKRFNPSAMFNQHLNTALSQQLFKQKQIHQVAVFLPLTGPYKTIAQQIRNGIIQNQLAHDPNIELRFYNTRFNPSEPNQILSTYQTAKQNGADFIIGPLQKQNIDVLARKLNSTGGDDSVIALNDAFGIQHFNYISNSEALQIATKLCQKHYKSIAILTSTTPADSNLAVQIADYWQKSPDHRLSLKSYPAKHPKLRQALGSVINETNSQARKNNLQWLFREHLAFTPRTRKDLDAIVLLGNAKQVAVFKPQFAFFELQLPVYGSSKLTPIHLDKSAPNKDLSNVIFPTFNATLESTELNSKLEAYGWDSFTLATQKNKLGPNICLNTGMMGGLNKEGQEFDYKMAWAKYDHQGKVVPLTNEHIDSTTDKDADTATDTTTNTPDANTRPE